MAADEKKSMRTIMDREKMMSNPEGCPACGKRWNMGDPVVYACGPWGDDIKLIHETDAVFDAPSKTFVEKKCLVAFIRASGRIPFLNEAIGESTSV